MYQAIHRRRTSTDHRILIAGAVLAIAAGVALIAVALLGDVASLDTRRTDMPLWAHLAWGAGSMGSVWALGGIWAQYRGFSDRLLSPARLVVLVVGRIVGQDRRRGRATLLTSGGRLPAHESTIMNG